jgi:hypothetical protein
MLGFINKSPDHFAALDRVRAWTRARFALPDDVAVTVSEVACMLAGCPPRETVITFWTAPDRRHHFKVFKPVAKVVEDDLPPRWMRDALVVPDDFVCDCC